MNNPEWVKKYNEVNNSFEKKIIFRVGIEAGFFSEFNHLVLAVIYCLQHNIKFVLSSKKNNFSYSKGWQDYFLPFTSESFSNFDLKYNLRSYQLVYRRGTGLVLKLIKFLRNTEYLTQDIWDCLRDVQWHKSNFTIDSLDISGDLLSTMNKIVNNIWRFQPHINEEINSRTKLLNLPTSYVGVHIRSGDKAVEHDLYSVDDYMSYIASRTTLTTLYIATDDFKNIKLIRDKYKNYQIYTLCTESFRGYDEAEHKLLSNERKRKDTISLFIDVELLCKASLFIGTFSSNVGTFVGIRRNKHECYGLDFKDWRIW